MKSLISIYKLTKYAKSNKLLFVDYFNKKKLLSKVSFNIYENEILGVVGESGSGKSILGKLLVNLLNIDSGKIYFRNKEITEYNKRELSKELQIAFQNPKSVLNLKMTVFQIISEPILSHKLYKSKTDIPDMVESLIKEVSLNKKKIHTLAEDLNLMDLKKLMFARALSLNPEFIVVDELLSRQDSIELNSTIDLIKKIKKNRNISILLISGNIKLILGLVNRVAIFYKGNLLEFIPKERFSEMGLHPYSELLFNKVDNDVDNIEEYVQLFKVKRKFIEGRCIFLDRCNFVQDICYKKMPEFKEIEQEHFVSCWLYNDKEEDL
jgi:peptide/nickel transport system ATP-binding protein